MIPKEKRNAIENDSENEALRREVIEALAKKLLDTYQEAFKELAK